MHDAIRLKKSRSPVRYVYTDVLIRQDEDVLTPEQRKTLYHDTRDDPVLQESLAHFNLSQLESRLSWIPYEELTDIECVGQGGVSTVYSASYRTIKVVFKEMDPLLEREIIYNMITNVNRSSHLDSPINVIGLSKNPEKNKVLMVTEHADGGSLDDIRLPLTETFWSSVFEHSLKIVWFLAYKIHNRNLTHGNLHPGNVVFKANSFRAAITDAGLAEVVQNSHDERGVYGRPEYMPPEAFNGQDLTKVSDTYCLGTLLWQLVVGVPPRATAATIGRLDGLREDPIPGAPAWFMDIIVQCWQPDRNERPYAEELYHQIWCKIRYYAYPMVRTVPPPPFLSETKEWIEERRAAYDREVAGEAERTAFTFADGTQTITHRRQSGFYSRKILEELSC